MQLQLLGLWHQLAAGEPLVVRCLLPPAHLLHHVRRCHFSRGEEARQRRRAAAATAGVQQQGGAAADADADAAAAGELRRGYLQLAGTLIHESSAAAARQAGGGAPAGSSAQSADDGLQADVQSILSLVADCCTTLTAVGSGSGGDASASDSTLLQELLSVLLLPLLRRDSLARLPLLACLQRQGGASLLLPLLCLEQQQLRLLGLRAITACLSGGDIATLGRSRSATPEPGASSKQGASLARARPGSAAVEPPGDEASDVIAAAGEALAAFPLTAATRIALLELLCDGAPWRQVGGQGPWRCLCRSKGGTHFVRSPVLPFRSLQPALPKGSQPSSLLFPRHPCPLNCRLTALRQRGRLPLLLSVATGWKRKTHLRQRHMCACATLVQPRCCCRPRGRQAMGRSVWRCWTCWACCARAPAWQTMRGMRTQTCWQQRLAAGKRWFWIACAWTRAARRASGAAEHRRHRWHSLRRRAQPGGCSCCCWRAAWRSAVQAASSCARLWAI